MLWKTNEPVTKEAIDDFRKYPTEVISLKLYETRYKGKPDKEHRYLKMARLYEYLVFAYHVKGVHKSTPVRIADYIRQTLGLPGRSESERAGPVDEKWLSKWIAELKCEEEFQCP